MSIIRKEQLTNPLSASYVLTASYAENASSTSVNTGSLLTTASINLNTITFTKGNGSTFPITVDTGSGGTIDTSSLVTTSSFNAFTASINTFTASYNTGSFSGSFSGSFNGTASWAQSASQALTVSFVSNAFLQGGNSFGTTATLGTNDAQNLQIETNGSTRFYISASGLTWFDGGGQTTPPFTSDNIPFQVSSGGSSNGIGFRTNILYLYPYTTTTKANTSSIIFGTSGLSAWNVRSLATSSFQIRSAPGGSTGTALIHLVSGSSGQERVGILTENPQSTLDVNGSTRITGSLIVTGSTTSTLGFTGSLFGTASWAQSASQALTASYYQETDPIFTAVSGTFVLTSSFNAFTSSINTFTSSYNTGSFSGSFTGSFNGTASWATNAQTASYVLQAISASFASNGGVTQLLAGPNITLSPTNGLGQVTITSTGGGGSSFNTATGSYGSFYSTQTQTNVAGTVRSMSLNVTDITNGVSISGSTNPFNTYIKTQNAGVYNIQFSAQVDKTDSGTDEIWIWIRKNNTDLLDTATSLQLVGNGAHYVAAWNFFVNAAANDYFQLMWYSPDANVRLHAEPAFGVVPGIPSLIVTANRVDQFLSNTGSFSGSFTGNLIGTATTASYISGSVFTSTNPALSASYALTASYAANAGSTFNSVSSIIGNGLSSSFNINHGFNTRNLHITVYESGSNGETVYPDIRRINDNTASILFANPPVSNEYIVYISQ